MRLVERDYQILREVDRWQCPLGRHIKELVNFSGLRATDRRLKVLLEAEYLKRQKVLYGIPSIYSVTRLGKKLINVNLREEKIRIDQIIHHIDVLDTAIFFNKEKNISFENMITEKELHRKDGFGRRKHRPDFVYHENNKSCCVEVELALKEKIRFEKNIEDNFLNYDIQEWIVPKAQEKIRSRLVEYKIQYPNIKIYELEEIKKYD